MLEKLSAEPWEANRALAVLGRLGSGAHMKPAPQWSSATMAVVLAVSRQCASFCCKDEEGNNRINPEEKGLLREEKSKAISFESNEFKCFCPFLSRVAKEEKKGRKQSLLLLPLPLVKSYMPSWQRSIIHLMCPAEINSCVRFWRARTKFVC